ncbi:MAG: TrbL/VirB6 family protein [Steroidobacteraceae bacterium]
MGFFATFSTWLNGLLSTYIATNTARVAALLQPAIVTFATLYVMIWGYLLLTGKIEEPFVTGVKRIVTLAVVLGAALDLWLYNTLIVDTFFNAPGALAAGIIGAFDSVGIVDNIILTGGDAASLLLQKGGLFQGDISFYIAGFAVYAIVGLTAIYTMFLLALSKIALCILLALGPLFMALLLFDGTKRFVEAWIAQLANYAFVTILTVLVAALLMSLLTSAAQAAVARGGGIQVADAVRVCLAAGLTLLIMRQVMPMASGLASGVALSSFSAVSALVAWGLGRAVANTGQFARGLTDRETTRWDALSRKAGFYLGRGTRVGVSGAARLIARPNTIRPI